MVRADRSHKEYEAVTNRFVKTKAMDFLEITGIKSQYNLYNGQVVISLSAGGITEVEVIKKPKRVVFR